MIELFGGREIDIDGLDLELYGGYKQLIGKLALKIGDAHIRLRDPQSRITEGDHAIANLTYGELVYRIITTESPQLPEGAVRYDEPRAILTFFEHHLAAINAQLSYQTFTGHPKTLANLPVTQLQEEVDRADRTKRDAAMHPRVEGYEWFRGYKVSTEPDTSIIIFAPWVQPWAKGGAPFPTVYAVGEPEPELVQQIALEYKPA